MLGTLALIDSCVDYSTKAVPIVPFVDASFNELGFSSILRPHSHVILHAGLARSCRIYISKSEGKPSSWRSVPVRAIKSFGESALPRPSTNVCNGPPLPEGEG